MRWKILWLAPALLLCLAAASCPPQTQKVDLSQLKLVEEIEINQTDDANLPFRFTDNRPFAISMNKTIQGTDLAYKDIQAELAQKGLLKDVVFEWFGDDQPKAFEVAIGRRMPVAIAQAVIRACSKRCPQAMVLSIIDEDKIFGHTQRVYIGSYVKSGNNPVTAEGLKELLKSGLSQQQFLKLIQHR